MSKFLSTKSLLIVKITKDEMAASLQTIELAMKLKIKTIIYTTLMFCVLNTLWATPPAQKEKSSRRQVKMGPVHRVLPLTAKVTNGIISTTAGASMFIAMPIADKMSHQKVDLKLRYFAKGEQGQYVFGRPMPIIFTNKRKAYSWGLYQINASAHEAGTSEAGRDHMAHELGHGVAVDMMGPLIIPIGIVDYIQSGTLNPRSPHYNNSFIEQAADLESTQSEMIGRQFHLGLSTDHNLRPGIYFLIKDETTYGETKNPKTLQQTKVFHLLKTGVQVDSNEDCDCETGERISGEFGLGDYETRMLVGDGLKLSLKGFYKVLDYKRDRHSDSRIDLYQGDNLVGVAIPLGDDSSLDIKGGISLRSSVYFNDEEFQLIDLYAGLAAEMNISIEDFLKLQAYYQSHAGIQSSTTRFGGSASSAIPVGETVGIDLSVNGEREIVSPDSGQSFHIDHLRLNLGVNF